MFNIFKKRNKNNKDEILEIKEKDLENDFELVEKNPNKERFAINKDITIYTMPERFRLIDIKVRDSKKTGLFIVIGGVIFLMVIFAGLYFYLFKMKPENMEETGQIMPLLDQIETEEVKQQLEQPGPKQSPSSGAKKSKIKSDLTAVNPPKETYLKIKAELDTINTFNDYEKIIEKYGSRNKLLELEKQKKEYYNLPDLKKEDFFASIIQSVPASEEIKDIKERLGDKVAILYITIKGVAEKGIVKMVAEEDKWKLESENWPEIKKQDESVSPATPVNFTAAIDSDNDGLTDEEEELLGCNLNSMDSDGDGYNDLSEVMNLYNPAGPDKLINNPNISKYLNNTFNYNLLYPDSWMQSTVGGDDSIIFKSSDNHFIQIIVQSNNNNESIESWYSKQFNVSTISDSKKMATNNWRGIRSDDGLIIYLTDNEFNYIYTITYNPGTSDNLEYINIFEMMIKSLVVGI